MSFCPPFFVDNGFGTCDPEGTIFDFNDPIEPIGPFGGGGGNGIQLTTCLNPVTGERRAVALTVPCPPGFFPLFTGEGTGPAATGFQCDIICLLLIAIGLMVISDV